MLGSLKKKRDKPKKMPTTHRILATVLILSTVACAVPEQHTGEQVKTAPPETSLPEPTEPVAKQTARERARKILEVILGGVNR